MLYEVFPDVIVIECSRNCLKGKLKIDIVLSPLFFHSANQAGSLGNRGTACHNPEYIFA